jgi:type III secretion protein V
VSAVVPVPIPIRLHPGDFDAEGWNGASRREGARPDPSAAVESALQELIDLLGIPAVAQVEVGGKSPTGYLQLSVGDELLSYPRELLDRSVGRRGDPGEYAPDLPHLVTEIVKRHPQSLLDPASVQMYLAAAEAVTASEEPADLLPARRAAAILGALLGRSLTLTDLKTIGRALRDGSELALADEEITELLTARLRPHDLDVQLHPEYARMLLEEDLPPGTPLPVRELTGPAAEPFELLEQGLLYELGIRLPAVRIVSREDVPPGAFTFRINHLTGALWRGLTPSQRFANAASEQLRRWQIAHEPCVNPANGVVCGIVDVKDAPALEAQGIYLWDPLGYLLLVLAGEARRRAGHFIDLELVEYELSQLEPLLPHLVEAALGRVSVFRLTAVLRLLLEGGVPIRDLRRILESALAFDYVVVADSYSRIVLGERLVLDERLVREPVESSAALARHLRKALRRAISQRYTGGTGELPVYQLDRHAAEEPIFRHARFLAGDPDGRPLSEWEFERLRHAIREELASPIALNTRPVILANTAVAEFLRGYLAAEFPYLAVLAYEDLAPEVKVQSPARISPA